MSDSRYAGKDKTAAIVLAILLGVFGVHRFYLKDIKMGVVYLVLSWTTIPFFLGLYDSYKYYSNPDWFAGAGTGEFDQASPEPDSGSASAPVPDSDAVLQVEGVNGRVTLFDDRLEISREDIGMLHKMQHGFKGDKEIPYESITSIQLRKPSTVTRGYIQFGQSGFSESDDGLMDATSDENTVLFEKDSLSEFEELRAKVRELKKGDVEESTGSIDEAMEELRQRYAKGEIEEEEYEKRREVLEK